MKTENLEYKIVMNDGADTEVLGRLSSLDIASAAYLSAGGRQISAAQPGAPSGRP